jgi:hypothetical protein
VVSEWLNRPFKNCMYMSVVRKKLEILVLVSEQEMPTADGSKMRKKEKQINAATS